MIWRFHDSGPLPGALNMETDEAMARQLAAGVIGPSLRFYGWRPWALSLGFHQESSDVDGAALARAGIGLVRRPTGGKAILHARELTYCVVLPIEKESPREIYRFINERLIAGLRRLGIEASLSSRDDDFRRLYQDPASLPCFSSSARSEVLVGGKKLVGSAQRKLGAVILQHGSILIGPEHRRIAEFLAPHLQVARSEIDRDLREKTTEIETILGRECSYGEVAAAIREGFALAPDMTLVDANREPALA